MSFKMNRQEPECWREYVARTAAKYGLQTECLEYYDAAVARGEEDHIAARDALYEWDCLELAP